MLIHNKLRTELRNRQTNNSLAILGGVFWFGFYTPSLTQVGAHTAGPASPRNRPADTERPSALERGPAPRSRTKPFCGALGALGEAPRAGRGAWAPRRRHAGAQPGTSTLLRLLQRSHKRLPRAGDVAGPCPALPPDDTLMAWNEDGRTDGNWVPKGKGDRRHLWEGSLRYSMAARHLIFKF